MGSFSAPDEKNGANHWMTRGNKRHYDVIEFLGSSMQSSSALSGEYFFDLGP